ncbi:myosin light chain kinase A-like [Chironomus tepperi]|uniref:myosin light chain kinase A-like n=1 Tax=Chironomus tepperi TaxID=113505 RepID=UPI00391FBB85
MDGNNVNRQVADTQEMDSQTISQQYYTCEDYDNWGTLKDMSNDLFFLKAGKTYFGREIHPNKELDADNYIFNHNKMKKSVYDRLSKTHFMIERAITSDNSKNYEPAVITCLGRNGIYVGGSGKMKVNEKRIIKDGDWISLSQGVRLFLFTYVRTEELCIERSCEIHSIYYIGETIGRGACGQVRKVYNLVPTCDENNTVVFNVYAIKCVEKPKESLSKDTEEAFNSLLNEVTIMKKIEHAHVLRLFAVFESTQELILVFPFMKGGDLLSKILKQPQKYLSEDDSKYFFLQLISGLKYLHSKGITHRDIKPENILLSDQSDSPLLSIADFGLSKMNDTMRTQCGTEVYVAPEILKKRSHYTNAVDIWSSGVFLYAMLTGRMPFNKNHNGSLRDHILAGKYEFIPASLWNRMQTAKSIINFMLQVNPRNRMTAHQLLEHRWLKDDRVHQRLERAYLNNNINTIDYMDETTDELEKTLVNVSIHEEENPPKRQKLR